MNRISFIFVFLCFSFLGTAQTKLPLQFQFVPAYTYQVEIAIQEENYAEFDGSEDYIWHIKNELGKTDFSTSSDINSQFTVHTQKAKRSSIPVVAENFSFNVTHKENDTIRDQAWILPQSAFAFEGVLLPSHQIKLKKPIHESGNALEEEKKTFSKLFNSLWYIPFECELAIGEQHPVNYIENLEIGSYPLQLINSLTLKLERVEGELAYYSIQFTFEIATSDFDKQFALDGSGSGHFIYHIPTRYLVDYQDEYHTRFTHYMDKEASIAYISKQKRLVKVATKPN